MISIFWFHFQNWDNSASWVPVELNYVKDASVSAVVGSPLHSHLIIRCSGTLWGYGLRWQNTSVWLICLVWVQSHQMTLSNHLQAILYFKIGVDGALGALMIYSLIITLHLLWNSLKIHIYSDVFRLDTFFSLRCRTFLRYFEDGRYVPNFASNSERVNICYLSHAGGH